MSPSRDPDQQFHENLRLLGRRIDIPSGPTEDVRSRCVEALEPIQQVSHGRVLKMITKKPFVFSGLGLAASIALVVTVLSPWNGSPPVHAAMILEKLNEQIDESPRLEIRADSLCLEGITIDGGLQVTQIAVVGDVRVHVDNDDVMTVVTVDVSLALSEDGGWILIRNLTVGDPEAQAVLGFLFPQGSETLLLLPESGAEAEDILDLDEGLQELRSGELVSVLKEVINAHEELGATIEHQGDGTILLTLPIKDAEVLTALARLAVPTKTTTISIPASAIDETDQEEVDQIISELETSGGGRVVIGDSAIEIELEMSESGVVVDEGAELIGSTLIVVYDPEGEVVRSFSIQDIGDGGGSITVTIGEGPIDPDLLDADRVKTPTTRVMDLGALESLFESFE